MSCNEVIKICIELHCLGKLQAAKACSCMYNLDFRRFHRMVCTVVGQHIWFICVNWVSSCFSAFVIGVPLHMQAIWQNNLYISYNDIFVDDFITKTVRKLVYALTTDPGTYNHEVKVKVTLRLRVSQSVSMSWCRASLWGPWPDFMFSFLLSENCFALHLGVPSLTRGLVCNL
jgi:hypothetical protein